MWGWLEGGGLWGDGVCVMSYGGCERTKNCVICVCVGHVGRGILWRGDNTLLCFMEVPKNKNKVAILY